MNMAQSINDALKVEMRRNDAIVVIGEDVARLGECFVSPMACLMSLERIAFLIRL